MSMPPLKKAPSSMLMRAAETSPFREPSARMSTRSVATTLPRTLPRTTISRAVMLAATWPLRPMVTRLPVRLMLPSTLPSTKSDSEPVISPLMKRLLPMVACSALATGARLTTGSTTGGGGGAGRTGGSGVGGRFVGPGWLGFHIALKTIPFLSCWDGAAKAGATAAGPKKLKVRTAGQRAIGGPIGGSSQDAIPSWSAKTHLVFRSHAFGLIAMAAHDRGDAGILRH